MRQDITATSGAPSSSASRGHAMDRKSTVQETSRRCTEDLESNWMQNKMQRHSHKRRSLVMKECSLAIGNTSSLKRTTKVWKTKLQEMDTLDESMDITTVNEQSVQWDFTNVEMRNQSFRKIVAEKPFLLIGAHPCANWKPKSNASWGRMTQREKDYELHSARAHMQFVCRMYELQHDEGRYFLHEHCQSELPWRKDCVEEMQEMTSAKLMSVSRGTLLGRLNCRLY